MLKIPPMHLPLLIFVALVTTATLTPTSYGEGLSANAGDSQLFGKATLGKSKTAAVGGDLERSETLLLANTFNEPDTVAWHIEVASRLLQVAFLSQESNDLPTAQKLAQRALHHLKKAERNSSVNDALRAQINTLRGVIAERLLGTSTDAEQEYREALKHNADDTGAKERLKANHEHSANP